MNAEKSPKNNIQVKNGWGICPQCGNPKMIKTVRGTMLRKFPAYCKYCKAETIVNWKAPEK